MMVNKVELCGVNTSKLPLLKEEEKEEEKKEEWKEEEEEEEEEEGEGWGLPPQSPPPGVSSVRLRPALLPASWPAASVPLWGSSPTLGGRRRPSPNVSPSVSCSTSRLS